MGVNALLWLTWLMRVIANGNLTVEWIRAQRFDIACRDQAIEQDPQRVTCCQSNGTQPQADRVELSPEALANDPWTFDNQRVSPAVEPMRQENTNDAAIEPPADMKPLSPVVGSPALSGLGASWVVPGTLLDVVA